MGVNQAIIDFEVFMAKKLSMIFILGTFNFNGKQNRSSDIVSFSDKLIPFCK
jgi:hypothetical protein